MKKKQVARYYVSWLALIFALILLVGQSSHAQGTATTEEPTAVAATDQPTATDIPIPDAPWSGLMTLVATDTDDASQNQYMPPASVVDQIDKDWETFTATYLSYPQQLLTPNQLQHYSFSFVSSPDAGNITTPASTAPVTYDVASPLARTIDVTSCEANGAICQLSDQWTSVTDLTYDVQGKIINSQPMPGYQTYVIAVLVWDSVSRHWELSYASWAGDTDSTNYPFTFKGIALEPTVNPTTVAKYSKIDAAIGAATGPGLWVGSSGTQQPTTGR